RVAGSIARRSAGIEDEPDVRWDVRLARDRAQLLAQVVTRCVRRDAAPEARGGCVVLLERDFPRARMQVEELPGRGSAEAVPPGAPDHEELVQHTRPPRDAGDEREPDRPFAAVEEVAAPIRIVFEERLERPGMEKPLVVEMRVAELREVVSIE